MGEAPVRRPFRHSAQHATSGFRTAMGLATPSRAGLGPGPGRLFAYYETPQ